MIDAVLKSGAAVIAYLVVADIAGVLVLTIVDVLPFRFKSSLLAYAVWFVFGVFAGLFSYNLAGKWSARQSGSGGDWTTLPRAREIGSVVMLTQVAAIAALCALFHRLYWSQGVAGDDYVPDSWTHSAAFFVAALAAIVAARLFLMPASDRPKIDIR